MDILEQSFASIGLKTEYGGPHSNGITHMSLLGFDDGSYIELISSLEPGKRSPLWHEHIANSGGPCAWAVEVDDVAQAATRIAALGIPVNGPNPLNRQRPDGRLVEWDLAFLGDGAPGSMLPFVIKDRTPRDWRVRPSPSVSGTALKGVARVCLGVSDLSRAVALFRLVYSWPAPQFQNEDGIAMAHFSGTPVILMAVHEMKGAGTWLSNRLALFGDSPCAYLLGSKGTDRTSFLSPHFREWFGHRVQWFDTGKLNGVKLGVIGADRCSNGHV